ncbi:MAG: ABC transporter ATP-binding protein [Candidatus Thermoplasmatota archaeon]|nr:ABC transporter ATP-binding protein [Candidatus Thermoplasmatota archaeon]
MIEIRGLSKIYGRNQVPAINNIDLDINDGEILGFAGLNGAGKTTTIRIACGIIFPTGGKVSVDGHDIVKNKVSASKNIGWVPELPNFEPNAKPVLLLKYYAGFYGIKGTEAEDLIEKLMKQFNIWDARNKKLKNYSQGMKKRFSIAAAMLGDPKNYLFDETLNGLDPEGVKSMRNFMLQLKKDGKSVFLSSHILTELENVADRIAIIKRGELIKILDRDELPNLGKSVVKLKIENLDGGAVAILQKYGTPEVTGKDVVLRDLAFKPSEAHIVNNELIKSNYEVSKFEISGEGLEEYFLDLVGQKGGI